MPELRSSGARSSNGHVQGNRNRSISGAVAAAAIPAVVLSGMAAAAPAMAVEAPTTKSLLVPKAASAANIAAAQQRIAAHLVASHVPARITVAAAAPKSVSVKAGDTLSHIALRHDVSLATLLKANHLKASDTIYPGQKLKLSGGSSAPAKSTAKHASTGGSSYTVKAGDTLSGIAHQKGVSLSALLKTSGLKASDTIFPGQKLKLSGGSSAPAKSTAKHASTGGSSYTIKAGDTLSGIASKHGIGLSKLLQANNLSNSSVIYPGKKLKLTGGSTASSTATAKPAAKPAATTSYTVKAGDTLSGIASKHGIGLSKLLQANNLSNSSVIYPGKKLKLTGGSTASSTATAKPAAKPAATTSYTVKAGDTLSGIASKHGIGLSKLLQANNLSNSSVIYPGKKLKLTGGSTVSSTSSAPRKQLVSDTFLHYKYPASTVSSANDNKYELLSRNLPSRAEMKSIIASTARKMGVDPSLALAHAYQESGFNMAAVSPANAIGAMQVIPSSGTWASELVGRPLDLLNPYDNATAGVAIIRSLQRTSKSVDLGIASYYQGQGSVNRNGMFNDTKAYVKSVRAHQKTFN